VFWGGGLSGLLPSVSNAEKASSPYDQQLDVGDKNTREYAYVGLGRAQNAFQRGKEQMKILAGWR